MIKLKDEKRKRNYSEIGQLCPFKFAFVSADGTLCHSFVKCRDFLQDALRTVYQGGDSSIYGFSYDPKLDALIDTSVTRIAVQGINAEQVESACHILSFFEAEIELYPLTQVEVTQHKDVFVFITHKTWIESPFAISLYTFLIRLGWRGWKFSTKEELIKLCNEMKETEQVGDNDCAYMKVAGDVIWKLMPNNKHLSWKEVDYSGHPIHCFHNNSGIVSLAKLRLPNEKVQAAIKQYIM